MDGVWKREINKKSDVVQETVCIKVMAVAMAMWRLHIESMGFFEHLGMGSETGRKQTASVIDDGVLVL